MEDLSILNFKKEIEDFTVEQLQKKREELVVEVTKMYLNPDLVAKISIIDQLIESKGK